MFGVKSKREKIKLNIVCENRQMIELICTRLYSKKYGNIKLVACTLPLLEVENTCSLLGISQIVASKLWSKDFSNHDHSIFLLFLKVEVFRPQLKTILGPTVVIFLKAILKPQQFLKNDKNESFLDFYQVYKYVF